MKNNNFNSRNIFLICFLILTFLIILLFFFVKNDGIKNNDISIQNNKYDSYSILLSDSKLNNKLKKYLDNDNYRVSISRVSSNYIFGDIHDISKNNDLFITKYLFKYDFINDKIDVYDFNFDYRLLYYYILDDDIYASLVFKNISDNISYTWSIIKFNTSFTTADILMEGKVIDPISSPVFHYSISNNQLYVVTVNDDFKINNNVINERKQSLNIYKINDKEISLIKNYNGDVLNKNGDMLCSIFEIQIYENQMLICTTDYLNEQSIKMIDLNTKSEEVLFYNDINDGLLITSFQRGNNGMYIGNISINEEQKGKTKYYDFNTNNIQEVDSEILYGRTPFINDKMLFHNMEKWSVFVPEENKFYKVEVVSKYKDVYLYPTFYVLNDDTILVMGNDNYFYIGSLYF